MDKLNWFKKQFKVFLINWSSKNILVIYLTALNPLKSKNTEEQQTILNRIDCKLILNFISLTI